MLAYQLPTFWDHAEVRAHRAWSAIDQRTVNFEMVLYLLNMGVLMNWQLIVVADLSHYHWQKYFLRTPNVKRFAGHSKKINFFHKGMRIISTQIFFENSFYILCRQEESRGCVKSITDRSGRTLIQIVPKILFLVTYNAFYPNCPICLHSS